MQTANSQQVVILGNMPPIMQDRLLYESHCLLWNKVIFEDGRYILKVSSKDGEHVGYAEELDLIEAYISLIQLGDTMLLKKTNEIMLNVLKGKVKIQAVSKRDKMIWSAWDSRFLSVADGGLCLDVFSEGTGQGEGATVFIEDEGTIKLLESGVMFMQYGNAQLREAAREILPDFVFRASVVKTISVVPTLVARHLLNLRIPKKTVRTLFQEVYAGQEYQLKCS